MNGYRHPDLNFKALRRSTFLKSQLFPTRQQMYHLEHTQTIEKKVKKLPMNVSATLFTDHVVYISSLESYCLLCDFTFPPKKCRRWRQQSATLFIELTYLKILTHQAINA